MWRRYWHSVWHKPIQLELFPELGDNEMAKVEKRSESPDFFAKGGKTKMFGKGTAGRAESDVSGKASNSPAGGSEKFASGGKSGAMFGKGHAGKVTPGVSGKQSQEG
jgi:hypothetical protein